jgi:hypothetical protein
MICISAVRWVYHGVPMFWSVYPTVHSHRKWCSIHHKNIDHFPVFPQISGTDWLEVPTIYLLAYFWGLNFRAYIPTKWLVYEWKNPNLKWMIIPIFLCFSIYFPHCSTGFTLSYRDRPSFCSGVRNQPAGSGSWWSWLAFVAVVVGQ